MTMSKKEDMERVYAIAREEAVRLLTLLTEHHDGPEARRLEGRDWGDIGSMNYTIIQLTELCETLSLDHRRTRR